MLKKQVSFFGFVLFFLLEGVQFEKSPLRKMETNGCSLWMSSSFLEKACWAKVFFLRILMPSMDKMTFTWSPSQYALQPAISCPRKCSAIIFLTVRIFQLVLTKIQTHKSTSTQKRSLKVFKNVSKIVQKSALKCISNRAISLCFDETKGHKYMLSAMRLRANLARNHENAPNLRL